MSFRQAAIDYRNYFALNQEKDVMKLKLNNPRSWTQETFKRPLQSHRSEIPGASYKQSRNPYTFKIACNVLGRPVVCGHKPSPTPTLLPPYLPHPPTPVTSTLLCCVVLQSWEGISNTSGAHLCACPAGLNW